MRCREPALQECNGGEGVGRAERRFEIRYAYAWITTNNCVSRLDALIERDKSVARLERIARRYDPPHFIKPQASQSGAGDEQMSVMGWIERATHQSNATTRTCGRRFDVQGGTGELGRAQAVQTSLWCETCFDTYSFFARFAKGVDLEQASARIGTAEARAIADANFMIWVTDYQRYRFYSDRFAAMGQSLSRIPEVHKE